MKTVLSIFLTLFCLTGFASVSTKAYEEITIISDLDDTIKISNVKNIPAMIINELFKEKIFAAMPELYAAMIPPHKKYYVVSGSNTLLRKRIEDTLEDNHMIMPELILKKISDGKTLDYKIGKMRELIQKLPGQFILIGDDTEKDPQALLEIKKEFPERVIATYIRSIRGIKLEAPLTPFMTAYEIAFLEVEAGRMDSTVLEKLEELSLEAKESLLLPSYVSCAPYLHSQSRMSAALSERISKLCEEREK